MSGVRSTARRPRGLSLIEVLCATTLLAMTAAAVLPLARSVTRTVDLDPDALTVERFAEVVDELLIDAESSGLDGESDVEVTIDWPEDGNHPPIVIRTLRASDDEIDHAWMVFQCGELAVSRAVPVDADVEDDAEDDEDSTEEDEPTEDGPTETSGPDAESPDEEAS